MLALTAWSFSHLQNQEDNDADFELGAGKSRKRRGKKRKVKEERRSKRKKKRRKVAESAGEVSPAFFFLNVLLKMEMLFMNADITLEKMLVL